MNKLQFFIYSENHNSKECFCSLPRQEDDDYFVLKVKSPRLTLICCCTRNEVIQRLENAWIGSNFSPEFILLCLLIVMVNITIRSGSGMEMGGINARHLLL